MLYIHPFSRFASQYHTDRLIAPIVHDCIFFGAFSRILQNVLSFFAAPYRPYVFLKIEHPISRHMTPYFERPFLALSSRASR